ncbi:hypothetical protein F8S13_11965 [Chloroflexia bacterium SDU3-3]|nr:hypothetical protein F8S13_11965 [Chloroflexia bacterium SDU3-3]
MEQRSGQRGGVGISYYALADLLAHLPTGERRTRHELQQALGCGDSTLDRLLAEAVSAGQVERAGRGMYQAKG